jgi:NADH-quinone oxidoreductase subunit C
MLMPFDTICTKLREKFGSDSFTTSEFRDNRRVHIAPDRIPAFMRFLQEDCGFDQLAELTAVDYLKYPQAKDRYGVIYGLVDTASGERLWVKTFVNDPDPSVRSVFSLWKGADWMEREVYDMYGIVFEGHPDLRRILLPPEFTSFPMRKDYPLRGKGERHNFPVITRAES